MTQNIIETLGNASCRSWVATYPEDTTAVELAKQALKEQPVQSDLRFILLLIKRIEELEAK